MNKNIAVTITRTCGSGGTTIAKLLADAYGWDYYDKKLIRLASDDSGISESIFAAADEDMKKSLLYKISRQVYDGSIIPPESNDFTSNDNLFNYQAKVMRELVKKESMIVIGRGADYVLRDYPYLLRVFIYAPYEDCLEHEMEWLATDRRAAAKSIAKTNAYREAYYKYHTGREWRNVENYDLCLNSAQYGYQGCADILQHVIQTYYQNN